jgi:hypothetical protein
MAVPLDQQFKIVKKGIIEERVPVLVNFRKPLFFYILSFFSLASIRNGTTLFCYLYSITNQC